MDRLHHCFIDRFFIDEHQRRRVLARKLVVSFDCRDASQFPNAFDREELLVIFSRQIPSRFAMAL